MKYLVGILLLWSQFGHAIPGGVVLRGCEYLLSPRPIAEITALLNTNKTTDVYLRLRTPSFNELDYRRLRDDTRRLGLQLRDLEVRPSGSLVGLDFKLSGPSQQITQFIEGVAADTTRPRTSLVWLKPVPRPPEPKEFPHVAKPEREKLDQLLRTRLRDLPMSNRAILALELDRIFYVGDLAIRTEKNLLRIAGLGPVGVRDIEFALAEKGLQLDMDIPWWPPLNLP